MPWMITLRNQEELSQINTMKIVVDFDSITCIEDFFNKIYEWFWCPDDFWLNINAFRDTIFDTEFWLKKTLNIICYNFDDLYSKNLELRMFVSDIMIDLINFEEEEINVFFVK